MADDLKDIQAVLQTYFDGVHHGDTAKLAAAFHETADLRGVNADGTLSVLPRPQWLEGLAKRPSAASQKLERRDAIISIDQSGPDTAFAKVQCQVPPRYFTDYLVLARLKDGWKIISKSYHTDVR